MKTKYSIGLLVALILTAGLALAQKTTPPPEPPEAPDENFAFSLFTDGGYLGVYAENINRENMARYHMSSPRGVGITRVVPGSPAEKAGLRKDDVILRLDGENITSVRKLNRLVSEIAPDQSVKVSVSRGGAEQEVTATIAKRDNSSMAQDYFQLQPRVWKWEGNPKEFKNFKWDFPMGEKFNFDFGKDGDFTFMLNNSRRIGVSTMQLTKQLAEYFGIADGKGVLVTSVTEDSPAAKAGVKAGDVITAIDGEAVDSPGDLARAINSKKEGDVTLTVIRNRSQQTFRVTPTEGGGFSGTTGRPQIGRRIVIPRIEIPEIPEIDIEMPRIRTPRIQVPAVDIRMPRIRVTPRLRLTRGERGPI
ncbi:MAG TPA: PDZ domain-containing protein [Pyrinomonadaceae bacterium]|jgi:membrane-associated protease RseP (regulator of RpoE activity)|nr:PDZ domain-containing protein [Pyrinomonadaceae bacterium]